MKVPRLVKIVVLLSVIIVMITILFTMLSGSNYDAFAKCLKQRGVKMYGASTDQQTTIQKAMFGKSFRYVNYIDCTANEDFCTTIDYTPTWEFADGGQVIGPVEMGKLAEFSGCKI